MSSAVAMASGQKSSRTRFPSLTACDSISTGCSGSPLFQSSDIDLNTTLKPDVKKSDGDDNNNNNRSASAYLLKLLDSKDLSNDLDASPSAFNDSDQNNFSYVSMKSSSGPNTRSASKANSSTQKKTTSRPSQSHRHKPAEVFRKDLISAMKIPDTSQLLHEEYWVMQDPWRIEWEKGVQVPVNQKSLPQKNTRLLSKETHGDFRMPRKMVKSSPDPGDKDMIDLNVLADSTCRYDLDELDVHWLKVINQERKLMGLQILDEYSMEQIMEELETQCHENMQLAIQTKEGLGIEYDEDIVCDVCRLPDCEEGNEMVFCDGCNLCVHQACYGILKVPEGSWLCKPCALGIRGSAVCILCDRKGGAMKSTRSGNKWAHVICALWIPEISIGDPERMEPITKVSHVPSSRWALLCSLCKERVGACIQCSVKHCVTAYHVTCAVEVKLDMIADFSGNSVDDDAVIFRSYCKKHSKNRKDSDTEEEKTAEEKRSQRHHRIMELEEEFFTFVKAAAVESTLSVPLETAEQVMVYWKLKRKANFNKPLITPKHEEDTALAEAAETNLQRRLRMFTHLRQDLERVRNLCYMIGRREKTKRATVKNMESVFLTQMKLLERRMCHESSYDSIRMVSTLQKFGKPHICDLARKESAMLAKSKEWTQPGEGPNESRAASPAYMQDLDNQKDPKLISDIDSQKGDSPSTQQATQHKGNESDIKHQLEIGKDSALRRSGRPKNGLHRKAFVSACRKREALLKKDVGKPSVERSSSIKEVSNNLSPRKRSYKGSSESELESENQVPPRKTAASKKSKLSKPQSWIAWRTAGAAASPSSFTVKTEDTKVETDAAKELARSNIASTRRTRSSYIPTPVDSDRSEADKNSKIHAESNPDARLYPKALDKVTLSPTKGNSHLIVKWDSDKSDSPNITEKSTVVSSRRLSAQERIIRSQKRKPVVSVEKMSDKHWSSEGHVNFPSPTRPATRSSNGSVTKSSPGDESEDHAASPRPPRRLAATKAKNVSGALARSCESGSFDAEIQAASPEQGLQKKHLLTQPNASDRKRRRRVSSNSVSQSEHADGGRVMSSIDNLPDEDVGYRGDMDESETEVPGLLRHKNIHSHHRMPYRDKISSKFSATGDSSHSDHQRKFVSKKHRLKAIRTRRRAETSLVTFKGYKDMEDETIEPKDKLSGEFDQGGTSLSPQQGTDQSLSKNEQAAGDVCDKNVELEEKVLSPVAGGLIVKDEFFPTTTSQLQSHMDSGDDLSQPSSQYSTSIQDYHGYMHNQGILPSNHMMTMPFVTPHNLYYSSLSQYPFHLWPPPPPPPPPPPEDSDVSFRPTVDGCTNSPVHALPDSTLSPETQQKSTSHIAVQASSEQREVQHFPQASSSLIDETHPMMEAASTNQLDVTNRLNEQSIVINEQTVKKKKKKIKKKKKKKKRKRKHSQSEYPSTLDSNFNSSGSEVYSPASSGYGEYCVEYCSTLADHTVPIDAIPEQDEAIIAPVDSPVARSTDEAETSVEPQQPTPMPPEVGSQHSPGQETSRLLLKIDKKRLAVTYQSEGSSNTSMSEDASEQSSVSPDSRGMISPLKLKLCGLKSDRTLRGGLVAREYEILESDEGEKKSDSKESPEGPSPLKANRASVALRRLGLQFENNPDLTEKRSLRDRKQPPKPENSSTQPPAPSLPGNSADKLTKKALSKSLKVKTIDSKKKTRPKKSAVPGTGELAASEKTSASVANLVPISTGAAPVLGEKLNPPGLSSPALQPERHWKKRKLHVHEASVTTDMTVKPVPQADISVVDLKSSNTTKRFAENIPQTSFKVEATNLVSSVPSDNKHNAKSPNSPAPMSIKTDGGSDAVAAVPNSKTDAASVSQPQSKPIVNKLPRKKAVPDGGKLNVGQKYRPVVPDGLPPVSPYKFTISNPHQKKMATGASAVSEDKSKTLNKVFTNKRLQVGGQSSSEQAAEQAADPYEFDFGS